MNEKIPLLPRVLKWSAFAAVSVNGFAPLAWILATSLKTDHELVSRPITWWPKEPTLVNYVRAFSEQPLLRFVGNSFAVSLLSSALAVVVAAAAAYALARLPVPRRGLWLTALIAVAMCPPASLLAPLFETLRSLGLLNSWAALVLPNAVSSLPVCTLVLVAFFRALPVELEEAALMDGCSRAHALRTITLPLAIPGLATAALLAFVNSWDEFLFALTFNATPSARTLPVGIMYYQGEYTFPWPVISAALVVGILPLAVLIVVFQDRVIGGLTAGGVKG